MNPVIALAQAAPQSSNSLGLLMIVAVFVIFYVLLIMPVQKRQKRTQQMIRDLKNGDRVITSGGLRGTIISLKDDTVQLRVAPDQLKLEFARTAIAQVLGDEATK